jgi:hypothetical protein
MKKRLVRACLITVMFAYVATWVWGIPAVHTRIAEDLIRNYKSALRLRRPDVGEHHPQVRFGASYAILPFVTVNHYEYRYGGLAGWGGFTIDVWYLTGTKTIFGITKWMS